MKYLPLILTLLLVFLFAGGCYSVPPTPDVEHPENPYLQFRDQDGNVVSFEDLTITSEMGDTYSLGYLMEEESIHSGQFSMCTDLTWEECCHFLACTVIENMGIPDDCTFGPWTCKCWLYDHASVREGPGYPWYDIGIYGAMHEFWGETQVMAIIEALCIMGYYIPEDTDDPHYPDPLC